MTDGRKRVLFLCIGNACRSQMAEAFARVYGADVMIPASAGLAPGFAVASDTHRVMLEKNIDIRDHFPKTKAHLGRARFDMVINMSGRDVEPEDGETLVNWYVDDPVREPYERHREIRDDIERRVVKLVLELRREKTS